MVNHLILSKLNRTSLLCLLPVDFSTVEYGGGLPQSRFEKITSFSIMAAVSQIHERSGVACPYLGASVRVEGTGHQSVIIYKASSISISVTIQIHQN